MIYQRITHISDPLFKQMHELMQKVFPQEEVLAFDLWKEPLEDPGIRIFVAIDHGQVVGATEYRYYDDFNVAMTDFTIIGKDGLGIGRFLAERRLHDLKALASQHHKELFGMFAEIYDPYQSDGQHEFGGVISMNSYVRREVLSHLGYKRLNFDYLHPSWKNNGEEVRGLDLCFMPISRDRSNLEAALVVSFLKRYYADVVLSNKPASWYEMISKLEKQKAIELIHI